MDEDMEVDENVPSTSGVCNDSYQVHFNTGIQRSLDRNLEEPMDMDMGEPDLPKITTTPKTSKVRPTHKLLDNGKQAFERTAQKACLFKPGSLAVVFDTSVLITEPSSITSCVREKNYAIIPYKVVHELDYLKKSAEPDTRLRATEATGILYDLTTHDNEFLILESPFQSDSRVEGFHCETNDDFILKCAFTFKRDYAYVVKVYFATNDKNLTLKAAANHIRTINSNQVSRAPSSETEQKKMTQKVSDLLVLKAHAQPPTASHELSEEEKSDNPRYLHNSRNPSDARNTSYSRNPSDSRNSRPEAKPKTLVDSTSKSAVDSTAKQANDLGRAQSLPDFSFELKPHKVTIRGLDDAIAKAQSVFGPRDVEPEMGYEMKQFMDCLELIAAAICAHSSDSPKNREQQKSFLSLVSECARNEEGALYDLMRNLEALAPKYLGREMTLNKSLVLEEHTKVWRQVRKRLYYVQTQMW